MRAPPQPPVSAERRRRISAEFGAAERYDSHSRIQREVAERLGARIAALELPAAARVLEVGCGTGHLTRALVSRFAGALVASDLSGAMVARCRSGLGQGPGPAFVVMDGEQPSVRPGLDLIASSMAFQWFQELPGSLARLAALLRPGGWLVFATLGRETFRQWREAHEALGMDCGALRLPTAAELAEALPAGAARQVEEQRLESRHRDGRSFLRELAASGATVPAPDYRPLAVADLRAVLRHLERGGQGVTMTWHVLYGVLRKEAR